MTSLRRASSLSVACASLALGLFACGGATGDDATGSPASKEPVPSSSGAPAAQGASVLIPKDGTIVVRETGGLNASGSDTSACTAGDQTYTYAMTTRQLGWKTCAPDAAFTKNVVATGARTLSADEAAALEASLDSLRVLQQVPSPCGADHLTTLEVSSPSALTPSTFFPDYYRCSESNLVHVSGLDDVSREFVALGH